MRRSSQEGYVWVRQDGRVVYDLLILRDIVSEAWYALHFYTYWVVFSFREILLAGSSDGLPAGRARGAWLVDEEKLG